MDGLNPCLVLIGDVRRALESGESVRSALRLHGSSGGELAGSCSRWLLLREKGGDTALVLKELRSSQRRALFRLLERGLRGEPIAGPLKDLEREVLEACRADMERHLALLPFKLMFPLLLLIFPALLILLFGPLLAAFSAGLTGM